MYSQSGSTDSAERTRTATASDTVLVALLGEIALRRDEVLAPVPGTRSRLLVAALASHPGRSRSAQALIDDVWGDEPPRAPMNALHTQVSRLRSALPEGALEIGPAGYRLAVSADHVDLTLAARLERRAREARAAGDDRTCLDLVLQARSLWRGEPGADLPPGPVAEELAGLAATRSAALDTLELSAREAVGDLPGAIDLAHRAATAHPFDESTHATLMRLLATAGRANEALNVFASLRTRLIDELGADPGPTVAALNTAILRGEPLPGASRTAPDPVASSGADHADQASGTTAFAPEVNGNAARRDAIPSSEHETAAAEVFSAIGLRAAPNPLLGRDADLDALEHLVRASRVTTILGPGGTGKTRVANELGARFARERSVVLVELASLRPDPSDAAENRAEIEAAIAATLGIGELGRDTNVLRPNAFPDTRRLLRETLASRPILLVLDNCEHVIDPVAEVVADLVGVSDQLTVLTTSRSPLQITAEAVYPLPPLTIDAAGSPATELFTARARAVRPSARLDQTVVARLCETLDGLPLAIELAAARVRTMSVEEIESRLDQRFSLLRSGDRGSPQRHRTLYAVIDWSWNLLDDEQRTVLRRLCRFPAGFTLSAAAALLADDIADLATAVDGLVSQSLLTVIEDESPGHDIRYRMLETVREFGEEQLARSGEIDLVVDRMLCWGREFAFATVRRYHDDEQVAAVLSTTAEADNLVALLRYAFERDRADIVYAVFPVLSFLWVIRGAHMDVVGWLPRLLALRPPVPTTLEAADLQMLGHVTTGLHLMYLVDGLRGEAVIRGRVRRLVRSGAPLSPVLRYLGELGIVRPEVTALARKLAEGVRSPDPVTRSTALIARANAYENAGDRYGSIRDAEAALRILTPGDVWGTAVLCQHLGSLYGQSARYAESVEYYRRAAERTSRLGAHEESVEMRSYLAVALAGIGQPEQARRELEPALGLLGTDYPTAPLPQPNHRRAAVASGLAEVALAEGDIESGLRWYRRIPLLLGWPDSVIAPGPGSLILVAAMVDAHVLYGRADELGETVRQLAWVAEEQLGQLWDVPQIGSVANAVGTYLLAIGDRVDMGLELLAMVPKVAARQDCPSMGWDRHLALHRPSVGAERMDAALARAARRGRRASAERVLRLLREFLSEA
ncbi:AfsR/SARP family transcriptional regulator [Nocardia sp. NPDC050406]|uniref:AfsR/SARP family transcriptional regulator n=1 Tax=Nocardia sp. NPDC050406 TaxID=3364318 RepID=UPI003794BD97